jgi:hypothetical protein
VLHRSLLAPPSDVNPALRRPSELGQRCEDCAHDCGPHQTTTSKTACQLKSCARRAFSNAAKVLARFERFEREVGHRARAS